MRHNKASWAYFKAFYQGNRLRFWAAMVLMALSTVFGLIFSKVLGDILDIINAGDLRAQAGMTLFQLVLIPPVVMALEKTHLTANA